jgi:hypothetical protein
MRLKTSESSAKAGPIGDDNDRNEAPKQPRPSRLVLAHLLLHSTAVLQDRGNYRMPLKAEAAFSEDERGGGVPRPSTYFVWNTRSQNVFLEHDDALASASDSSQSKAAPTEWEETDTESHTLNECFSISSKCDSHLESLRLSGKKCRTSHHSDRLFRRQNITDYATSQQHKFTSARFDSKTKKPMYESGAPEGEDVGTPKKISTRH